MNIAPRNRLAHRTFFDLSRAATVRESAAVRLRQAAKDGNMAAVKRLITQVANIQNPDPDNGYTTLMYAAQHGHLELVEFLLEMGHEEEVISVDNEGITVLMIAAMHNHEEIFYNYVIRYPECIHAISKNGWTALLYAAENGNANLVNYLLSISADIDHVDNEGNSALHHASAWGHTTVMELLVSQGCNVDLQNDARFTAYDYAYSSAVQDYLKALSQMPLNDDSSFSLSHSLKYNASARPYPSSLMSGVHPSLTTVAMTRGTDSFDSPTPRASTSSSSNGIAMATSPRGSQFQFSTISGSPSSYSDPERQRAYSIGDRSTRTR